MGTYTGIGASLLLYPNHLLALDAESLEAAPLQFAVQKLPANGFMASWELQVSRDDARQEAQFRNLRSKHLSDTALHLFQLFLRGSGRR